jgi:hypothetical protein
MTSSALTATAPVTGGPSVAPASSRTNPIATREEEGIDLAVATRILGFFRNWSDTSLDRPRGASRPDGRRPGIAGLAWSVKPNLIPRRRAASSTQPHQAR